MSSVLNRQNHLAGLINRFYTNMKKAGESKLRSVTYLETRLSKLEDYWAEFYDKHFEILEDPDNEKEPYVVEDVYSSVEEDFTTIKTAILIDIKVIGGEPTTEKGTSNSDKSYKHLPTLPLPKFSGDQLEWETFRDMFQSMVHDTTISNVQKLYYLKSSLSGKAADRLKNLPISGANYSEAWSTLVKRYDNKRVLLSAHMRKLLSSPAASKKSVDEILRLTDITNESIRAFKNMDRPVDKWDDWFVHLLVHKLDPSTREDWETSLKDSEDFPTIKELMNFLDNRVRALEAARCNDPPFVSTFSKSSSSQSSAKQKKSFASVNLAVSQNHDKKSNKQLSPCSVCQSSHFISYCPRFKKMNSLQRLEQVQILGLCFNCLRSNHSTQDCSSDKKCFVCVAKHHTFLHDNFPTQPAGNATINSSRDKSSSSTNTVPVASSSAQIHQLNTDETSNTAKSIFATAYVKLQSHNGLSIIVKGFIDSGAERSFITERAVQQLRIPKDKCDISLTGMGHSPLGSSIHSADLKLCSPRDSEFELPFRALVMKSLLKLLPKKRLPFQKWPHLQDLELADPNYYSSGSIDCLIGIDLFGHILRPGLRQGPFNSPTALQTAFGWIVFGRSSEGSANDRALESCSILHAAEDQSLNNQLRLFWELEETPKTTFLTEDEIACEAIFKDTHFRDPSGRYVVKLPMKGNPNELGKSRSFAVSMFLRIEKHFANHPEGKEAYHAFMQEYLFLHHMRPLNQEDLKVNNVYYLPHHVVTKKNDPSGKIRVVFNGSARTDSGTSLNDLLHSGQKLQAEIWLVVTRWRLFKFVFTADIVKMFRQIKVDSTDSNFQRIIWRSDPSEDLQDFCLSTVTYGTRPAPFLAIRTLNQLAADERDRFPLGAAVLSDNTYVDDIFSGAHSIESAITVKAEVVSILESAGISLSKWAANSHELLPNPLNLHLPGSKDLEVEDSVSTLGLKWSTFSDSFHFSVVPPKKFSGATKRSVASEIAKLFDPLGWLAPFIIRAKLLLQNLWISKVDWDSTLPTELQLEWESFQSQLLLLEKVKIPRWLNTSNNVQSWQLHGFSDASERAYSATVYLVVRDDDGVVHSSLIMAKTKVAPIKTVSLPKLELCGALLLTKLLDSIMNGLKSDLEIPTFCWTDSELVLKWLGAHPSRWETFEANRVSKIQTILKNAIWNHVPSRSNPADCATRGFSSQELLDSSLWWNGPDWLTGSQDSWPRTLLEPAKNLKTGERSSKAVSKPVLIVNLVRETEICDLADRCSSLDKLVRATAYCYRFCNLCRSYPVKSYLTTDELKQSLNFWLRTTQILHFEYEINNLKTGLPISRRKSVLVRLSPFLDGQGLLRVGGRLQKSLLSYDEKHPVILPKNDRVTYLILLQAHLRTLHGGQQLMLSFIMRRYWIIGAKSLINSIVHKCVRCARFRNQTPTQLMGQLPADRVSESKPFACTGVDYGGPYHLRVSPGRGHKSYKGYVCLFICLSSRAIHLEAVSDLSSDSFIAAFKRFVSRRGTCSRLYSDNGTNFVGADRELRALFRGASQIMPKVAECLANDGTTWSFIPPHAPHFGGIWEAGIKSTKHHLRRCIGDSRLTFEEFTTVLCQIEACLNSRPIAPISSDPTALAALTPGHLLTGGPISAIPEPSLTDYKDNSLSRWSLLTKMRDNFWYRWSREYLHHLQQRNKWLVETNQVQVGDLVLLKEDLLPPTKWSLARIEKLHPGSDGLTRVVTVRTTKGTMRRSLDRLALLPVKAP